MAKKRKKRSIVGMILSFMLLMTCLYFAFNYTTFFHLETDVKIDLKSKYKGDTLKYFFVDGKVLISDSKHLDYYELDGTQVWSKDLFSKNPFVTGFNDKIMVMDQSIGDVFLLDKKGTIVYKILDLGEITSLHMDGGNIAVFNRPEKKVTILNGKLEKVTEINDIDGKITSFGYSKKTSQIALTILDSDTTTVLSEIRLFDSKGKLTEVATRYDTIAYDIQFYKKGILYISDQEISYIELPGGKEVWVKKLERPLRNYDIWNKSILAYNLRGGENGKDELSYINRLEMIDFSGDVLFSSDSLDIEPSMIKTTKEFVALSDKKRLAIYDKEGNLVSLEALKENFLGIQPINNNQLVIMYQNKLELKTIK